MDDWESIPDETPIPDRSGLILKHVTTRAQLCIAEAENIHKAVVEYLSTRPSRRQAPFTLIWVHQLHGEMFGQVWAWAGAPRRCELNFGVTHTHIEPQLQTLLDDLVFWRDQTRIPALEQAAMLHHRAVSIHPYLNGNGRWARLLANIWLRQLREPITAWPDQTIGSQSVIREEYISAIRAADRGDLHALVELHRRFSQSLTR